MAEETSNFKSESEKIQLINTWFRIILTSAIVGTFLYKIIVGSFNLSTIDLSTFSFTDFLSLVLAIFSIGLSVMFYIKADETSNHFYDNTQKFTQNVSTILGRIEAGFGERLKRIDEGYNRLEGYYIQTKPDKSQKEQIQKNKQEVKKVEQEKDKIIRDFLKRNKLQDEEQKKIIRSLREKDKELEITREELFQSQNIQSKKENISKSAIMEYFNSDVLNVYDNLLFATSKREFSSHFNRILNTFNKSWIRDLKKINWLKPNGKLTPEGLAILFSEKEKHGILQK